MFLKALRNGKNIVTYFVPSLLDKVFRRLRALSLKLIVILLMRCWFLISVLLRSALIILDILLLIFMISGRSFRNSCFRRVRIVLTRLIGLRALTSLGRTNLRMTFFLTLTRKLTLSRFGFLATWNLPLLILRWLIMKFRRVLLVLERVWYALLLPCVVLFVLVLMILSVRELRLRKFVTLLFVMNRLIRLLLTLDL